MRFAISFAAIYYYICIIYSTTTNANNEKKETKRIIYLLRSILRQTSFHFISVYILYLHEVCIKTIRKNEEEEE